MDIYNYFPSKDVADYCKKIGYEFNVSAQRFQPLPRPSILTIFSSCKLANTSADT